MAQQDRGLQWQDYKQTMDWTSDKGLLTGIILSSFLFFLRYAGPKDYVEAQNICSVCLSLWFSLLYGPLLSITQPHFW